MVEVTSGACAGVECVQEAAWQTLTVMAGPWFVIPVMLVLTVVGVSLAIFSWMMKASSNSYNSTEE